MLTEIILQYALQIINQLGYLGIYILMTAESTFLPVPSEAVLPFAGYLIAQGKLGLIETILVATLGTITGALISYYLGKWLGEGIITKYGKYFFLNKKELDNAKKFFEKHGEKTIFICRFIPVIRHVISVPAGIAQMRRRKFITYTVLGGACWNTILIYTGILLEKNWGQLIGYTQYLDIIIAVAILIAIVWFVKKHL